MMVTDLRHFLDVNDEVPPDLTPEANELLRFLGHIVEAATYVYKSPTNHARGKCRCTQNGDRCPGELEVRIYFDNKQIGWQCSNCGDKGTISNWEGTAWDRRNYVRH